MADIIQVRRDTAANWTSDNPTLADGELGYEKDTQKMKVGDGVTAWNSLDYWIYNLDDGQGYVFDILSYSEQVVTDTWDTTTEDIDLSLGSVYEVTLSGVNVSTLTISNARTKAYSFTLIIHQDSTARSITWPASVIWAWDTPPDLSTVSETYIVSFLTTDEGTTWYGFVSGGEFA
jgi:hypothetical protein